MTIQHLLQVTEDHSVKNSGVTSAVDSLMRQVASKPVALSQTLFTTGGETIPLPNAITEIRAVPSRFGQAWRYPPGAYHRMALAVKSADVVHVHGIWMWVQWAAARASHKAKKPFVISTHGMLEPWIWYRQQWPHQVKKYLYWHLVVYPFFQHASVIHAIHSTEANSIKKYFDQSGTSQKMPQVVVIPHSLNLEAIDGYLAQIEPNFQQDGAGHVLQKERYILFLGRLHPVKGIDLLIRAFAMLETKNVILKIVGFSETREADYQAYLHQLVADLGLAGRVDFLGAVFDQRKWELLRKAWVFCLPSHSEVIGMVNLEAAACQTPVITTEITGVGAGWEQHGGIMVNPEVEQIRQALVQSLGWNVQERIDRGISLRRLIESTYSWKATIEQWSAVYDRLGGQS